MIPKYPNGLKLKLTNPETRNRYRELQQNSFQGRVIRENIADTYKVKKEVGNGNYGSVRIIAKRSCLDHRFALKSIHRDRVCSDQDIKMVEKELNILMNIDHPNIIEFQEVYMDQHYFHFVQQYCAGQDLFYCMEKAGGGKFPKPFAEATVARIIKQILLAIKHMHDRGICHRDLKLENIMVETRKLDEGQPLIKVIDFGLADYF